MLTLWQSLWLLWQLTQTAGMLTESSFDYCDSWLEVLLACCNWHGSNVAWWYGGRPSLHHKSQWEWREIWTTGCTGVHCFSQPGSGGVAAGKAAGHQDWGGCRSVGANTLLAAQQGRQGQKRCNRVYRKLTKSVEFVMAGLMLCESHEIRYIDCSIIINSHF